MDIQEQKIDQRFRPKSNIPSSNLIKNVVFDMSTCRTDGLGSDNWAITWADDDHQYTSFGDGVGFGASDMKEQGGPDRVGFGFGRVEGDKDSYTVTNVSGGKNPEHPADPIFGSPNSGNARGNGKCYGLISIDGTLYAWRIGDGHPLHTAFSELYKSTDHGASWQFTGVRFSSDQFKNKRGFFAPTFCQFGKDYADARDEYVYIYAPEVCVDEGWEVQIPGRVTLMRVPKTQLEDRNSYTFYTGKTETSAPIWDPDIEKRQPVFEDREKGVMRTSVSYNPGLKRYLLTSQQVSRWQIRNGHIGIYEAPEPWGPWKIALCANPWEIGLNHGYKSVFWNFSNKWLSPDGRHFVMVYTGPSHDQWGTVEGQFILHH